MSQQSVRVGIIGAGWPGQAHARGYQQAGGFKVVGVTDLIPDRAKKLMAELGVQREYSEWKQLLDDPQIDAISICLPTAQHAATTIAALKAGKNVVCETPPALSAAEARKIQKAAEKAAKVVLYGFQRRFGGPEQAAKQAIAKDYAGQVSHARAAWMRTRGVPQGTGWFTDKNQSGGGAMIDIGIHMLDLAWNLMGQAKPATVFAATHQTVNTSGNVEDAGFALLRFEGGATLELSASWAINQPPQQQGTICRLYGQKAAVDVYTPLGAQLYRNFDDKGEAKAHALIPPKAIGHTALMRHFRQCVLGTATPMVGPAEGITLMEMIEAIYESAEKGKSVTMKG